MGEERVGFEFRVLTILFAFTLQATATIPFEVSGLRVAVSDLFLPIALLYAVLGWWNPVRRPQWRLPGLPWWLLAITAVISIGLLIGYHMFNRWIVWALVNKWLGWFALAGYLVIGGSIVRVGGLALREDFLRLFLGAAAVVALVNAAAMPLLLSYYTLPFGIEFSRATGGMQNANAFGFLLVVASLLVIAMQHKVLLYLPALLTGWWFTSSRGALVALLTGLLSLLAMSPRRTASALKPAAVSVLAIVIITAVSVAVDPSRLAQARAGTAPVGFFSIERLDPEADTINQRRAQTGRAIDLFEEAPFFGHGLGYFIETTGETLHNSLLWLIIELGAIGTAVFVGFLLFSVRELYRGREDPFLLGMVAVSAAFTAMSLTGEFLYQRHLWLLLGMALALPPPKSGQR